MRLSVTYFTCLLIIALNTEDQWNLAVTMSKDCSGVQQVSQKLETVKLTGDKDAKSPVVR